MTNYSAAAMRRRLAYRLQQARGEARRTQQEVADVLSWPQGRLASYEDSSGCPTAAEVEQLCSLYGCSSMLAQVLQELCADGRTLPFTEYDDLHRPVTLRYFADEAAADVITQFEPLFIPGLLQTRAYTLSVLKGTYSFSDRTSERIADIRETRQRARSEKQSAPLYFFDQAAISRPVGDGVLMREQLLRLREDAEQGRAVLRVIPFHAGVYPGLMGPMTHLQFEDADDTGVVYVENSVNEFMAVDDRERIAAYRRALGALDECASSPNQTLDMLSTLIDEAS
jgi:Domain of unknown function (DUF5753)/Helix-turn-helix domain